MVYETNKKKTECQDNIEKPLFTGDYRRDTTVSEFEKVADASNAIYNTIKHRKKNNKKG